MNILIIGHRQHGKTTFGHLLARATGMKAIDSSTYATENIIYPVLKDKYGYRNIEECHLDRTNHRQEWFDLIESYNDVPDRMTRDILSEANIYVGMRSRMEFEGSKHHFDKIIWVDASDRKPLEDTTSMKLNKSDADIVVNNNPEGEDRLPDTLDRLIKWLYN